MSYGSKITGLGSAFPKTIMTNADFESFLDTTDEWIQSRTGIRERRIANRDLGETTLSLSEVASRKALEMAGVKASDIDFIVVGTVTPENIMPSTAVQLQSRLGGKNGFAFDLQAACSGFLYGLSIADQFIRSGAIKRALVVGAETLSTLTNWSERESCVLFGDGAGAAVIEQTETSHRIIATKLYSDGDYGKLLQIPHGFAKVPVWAPEYRKDQHKIQMAGREIFKHAVRSMVDSSQALLKENGLTSADLSYLVLHQANIRIIETCMKMLDFPLEKTWINLDRYGNTSAATLPTCLDEAWKAGKVKEGDLILMSTFGGGLTWASALVRL